MQRIFISALLCLSIESARAGERFEPGMWQSTSFVSGRKAGITGPRCVTAQEAQSMNGPVDSIRKALEADPAWRGCSIRDLRADAMRIDFTAACADAIVTTSQTTYRGSSYEGTISVTSAGTPTLAMSIKGERTGSCP